MNVIRIITTSTSVNIQKPASISLEIILVLVPCGTMDMVEEMVKDVLSITCKSFVLSSVSECTYYLLIILSFINIHISMRTTSTSIYLCTTSISRPKRGKL